VRARSLARFVSHVIRSVTLVRWCVSQVNM
jgi:hypothetical protein